MTVTAEDWLLDEIAATATRLSAICFVAVVAEDLDSKILLGRFAHDEAGLLRQACARLDEIAIRPAAPTSLIAALQNRPILLPERRDAAFLACSDWNPSPPPLATAPVADEPTHRYRANRIAVRERQLAELHAAAMSGVPGRAKRHTLDEIVAMLGALERPGRPATLPLSDARVSVGSTGALLLALLQQNLVNLEIPTIEMCCSLILEGVGMPLDFVADMARQAWDEARHAHMFWTRLEEVGGTVEAFSASTVLWTMCRAQKLAVRLAVHQCFGEWVGVDGAAWYRDATADAGDEDTSALFDAVMRDELGHVRLGHRWLSWLCPRSADRAAVRRVAATLRRDAGKSVDGPLAFPPSEALCRAGGFDDAEIDAIAMRYRVHGSMVEAQRHP